MPGSDAGLAWVDGRVGALSEPLLPVTDRGFLFADSVFETVRTYGRRPFLLGDHLDRLRRSAEFLALPLPWQDSQFGEIAGELLAAGTWDGDAAVRIVVTRGDGGAGLALPEPTVPRLVVVARPIPAPPRELYEHGVGVGIPASTVGKDAAIPAHVKSGSYIANVLALREARARGGFEALLRGPDGSFAEGTTSNLFLVDRGTLLTPGTHEAILPGITRSLVLSLARRDGIPRAERQVMDEDLGRADEIFLTSTIKEVLPVVRVDGRSVGGGQPGPVTRRVQSLFRAAVARLSEAGAWRMRDLPLR